MKITIFGSITSDKKLAAVFTREYQDLLNANPGKRIMIEITIIPEDGTAMQRTYFEKVVLPKLQLGFRSTGDDMSINDTLERVLNMCPATENSDPEIRLSKSELSELIRWSIQLCAEQFGIVVPEPNEDI